MQGFASGVARQEAAAILWLLFITAAITSMLTYGITRWATATEDPHLEAVRKAAIQRLTPRERAALGVQ